MNSKIKRYRAIGVMSGTSLDGLDMADCEFYMTDGKWNFKVLNASVVPHSENMVERLKNAINLSGLELLKLDKELGLYIGSSVGDFIVKNNIRPDFVASHGHTIFHSPADGYTMQIGCGYNIAKLTKLPVIYDFRSADIALGGQGAPLVPIGDRLLFNQYDACVNIGGISNISFLKDNKTLAFDICHSNMALNYLCQKFFNCKYDKDGLIAKEGTLKADLNATLNKFAYYQKTHPKTLGFEQFEDFLLPIISNSNIEAKDLLCTYTHHIAMQIAKAINSTFKDTKDEKQILFSGGGAKNKFLMMLIGFYTINNINIPDDTIIDYKEAIIFAFLGVLKREKQANCLSSVTGAAFDNIGGLEVNLFNT
ncbi:MAG: anhydro-N-acetylmuramic acid kinase [Bacteroidales bacterium]